MKKTYFISVLFVFAGFSFSACEKDKDEPLDVTTMLTPRGVKLPAAENGPVRSALGMPAIDLDIQIMPMSQLPDESIMKVKM